MSDECSTPQNSRPTAKPREELTYAPVKKRVHKYISGDRSGDGGRALFQPDKFYKTKEGDVDERIEQYNLSNGEQMEELIPMAASTVNRRMVCLQVAAFIFNNIPLYSISPHQKSPQSSRKRVSCSMDLSKEQYLSVFGNIGVRKDLCRLATPPKDGYDLFCKLQKEQQGRSILTTKTALQDQWNQLSEEEREEYEHKRREVTSRYNEQFNEEVLQKKSGNLPLYESRKIVDLKELEVILGPTSLQRSFAGYRTVAGQITITMEVASPFTVIYDESEHIAQFRFYASPMKK